MPGMTTGGADIDISIPSNVTGGTGATPDTTTYANNMTVYKFEKIVADIVSTADDTLYGGDICDATLGTQAAPKITVIDSTASWARLKGTGSGYGILALGWSSS